MVEGLVFIWALNGPDTLERAFCFCVPLSVAALVQRDHAT